MLLRWPAGGCGRVGLREAAGGAGGQHTLPRVGAITRLAPSAVEGILEAVRTRDYQVACRKQFEARFVGADSGPVGNHPNGYFTAAYAHLKALAAAAAGAAGQVAIAGAGGAAAGGGFSAATVASGAGAGAAGV